MHLPLNTANSDKVVIVISVGVTCLKNRDRFISLDFFGNDFILLAKEKKKEEKKSKFN